MAMPSHNFGDGFLGPASAGTTLQSLLESFGQFDISQQQQPAQQNYSSWPAPAPPAVPAVPAVPADLHPEMSTKSPMKFPSQVLTQNSRASPFSDTTESSLFSSCSNLSSRLDLAPSFTTFSTSSLMSSQSSTGKTENSLGLSDISTRLEELSQGSLMMSQGCSSTRDSTPLSWNPIANYPSSKPSSLTSSPVLSGAISQTKTVPRTGNLQQEEDTFFSDDEDEQIVKIMKSSNVSNTLTNNEKSLRNGVKPMLHKSMSSSCVPDVPSSGVTSWSQIVRTSSSKLPSLPASVSPMSSGPVTRASLTPSPPAKEKEPQLVVEEVPPTTNTVDFHRGPKVDPRWPVSQQVFLGPIPMSITWDEIRNVFYTKVQRRELLHFYVQSKPVNEVVYGQVVFDKPALANKVVKDGPVKVMN